MGHIEFQMAAVAYEHGVVKATGSAAWVKYIIKAKASTEKTDMWTKIKENGKSKMRVCVYGKRKTAIETEQQVVAGVAETKHNNSGRKTIMKKIY